MSKIKVQIMLPSDLVEEIERDAIEDFLKKSAWFERAAKFYFDFHHKKKGKEFKKVIDLNI